MNSIENFTITKHASERLYERDKTFAHIIDQIDNKALRVKASYDFVKNATEEKRFLNNSLFLIKLNEKYGFENKYTFFVCNNIVCVGIINQLGKFIVTVLEKNSHTVPHIKYKTQKFNKFNKNKKI